MSEGVGFVPAVCCTVRNTNNYMLLTLLWYWDMTDAAIVTLLGPWYPNASWIHASEKGGDKSEKALLRMRDTVQFSLFSYC